MTPVELMDKGLSNRYPVAIKRQIWKQVRDLLAEGMEENSIVAGLQDWDRRPGVSPALLPHLVADAIRTKPKSNKDWEAQLREEMGG